MEIRIICIGKIKDNNVSSLINDYLRKINFFHKCSVVELPEKTFNIESYENIKKSLVTESEYIKKYLENSYNIVLAIEGKQMSSIELSEKIQNTFLNSQWKFINFIIGSSHGVHQDIKDNSQLLLSFSKMTFPHQLFRIMLVEQIYRVFTIIKNKNYHK